MQNSLINITIVLLYLFVGARGDSCSRVPTPSRLDCHPEPFATEEACLHRNCCWSLLDKDRTIACFFPIDYPTYNVTNIFAHDRGYTVNAVRSSMGAYPVKDPSEFVQLSLSFETVSRLRIRITDANRTRWEPPVELGEPDRVVPQDRGYTVVIETDKLGFRVERAGVSKETLIDSTGLMANAFVYGDKFLQIAFSMNVQLGFGIGERVDSFPVQLHDWKRMVLWARDQIPTENANLYGVHNFFLGLSADGSAFGLFFLNSNAQEVIKQPHPSLVYRTLGGILDFFLFIGPSPADVVAQYYELIGRPPVPPYWSLGFQLSRYGFSGIDEIRETIARNQKAGMPLDVIWLDIDYMDQYRDWTLGKAFKNVTAYVEQELHEKLNLHVVIIVDPAIPITAGDDYMPYKSGLAAGVFVNDSRTGQPLVGCVWPGDAVFPDFLKNTTADWWFQHARDFYDELNYDGLWIDMNEPANFYDGSKTGCNGASSFDYPPYVPPVTGDSLFAKTVCPSALHGDVPHYNVHNMYALLQARVTRVVLQKILPGKRPFLLTRSSFAGSGRYTYHWSGDVWSSWTALAESIPQMLNFNLFGMPMIGADICGFVGDTTEELCVRWSQLGAFYPFSRNHNGLGSRLQDPAVWSEPAIKAIISAFSIRYQILPYMYTLLHESAEIGSTVARALFLEYPKDLATHHIDKQFLLGSCLMVAPVLSEGSRLIYVYLPAGRWVSVNSAQEYLSSGEWFAVPAPLNTIPVFFRGGCILPMHPAGAMTTGEAREMGIGLTVVLSSLQKNASASGILIWDDGVSESLDGLRVIFGVAANQRLTVSPQITGKGLSEPVPLALVRILGIPSRPSELKLNGSQINFAYDPDTHQLTIPDIVRKLDLRYPFELVWVY